MNVFKEMVLSIYSYGSYSQFLKNKKGKVFGFGLLLMLIYVLAVYIIPATINMASPNGFIQSFEETVPDFELKNGTLWVEEEIEIDQGRTYIWIDTNPIYVFYDADEMAEYLRGYPQAILMDSEKMIVKNNGEVLQMYYDELGWEFSRDKLADLLPMLYVMYYIMMIFGYIWMTALFFFGVLFVALLGMIVASAMKFQITYGQLYVLGIYSRTLPLLIKTLVSYLPFSIPYFWIFNFGLSLLIIMLAIRKMQEQSPQNPIGFTPPGSNM